MTGPEKCSLFVATRRLGVVRHTPAAYIKLHGNGIYQLRIQYVLDVPFGVKNPRDSKTLNW